MKRRYRFWLVCSFVFLLTACGSGDEHGERVRDGNGKASADASEGADAAFPVTVELDGRTITVEAKPRRIVAISLDTADAVLELTDPANVAAVADSIGNAHLAFQSEKGREVPHMLKFSDSQDPEKMLYHDPDLILLTKLHEGEMDAEQILRQSGVPLVSFQPWNTLSDIERNVLLIGELIGERDRAGELVGAMQARIRDVQKAVEGVEERRSVLVISPVGTNTGPFILGTDSLATELLRAAGALPAAELAGFDKTMPASAEQVIKMDPDYILLTDWDGEGESVFRELMEAPGWNTLQAVRNNRMRMIDAKYVVTANLHVAEGVEEIARWIYPERFEGAEGQ